jgi:glucose-1-phosphate cytidylyltransferase
VVEFKEKPDAGEGFVNGGFFVLSPAMIDLIDGDDTSLERTPLERLVAMGQLAAWEHGGFWHPMDTLRDRELLEQLWAEPDCPWRVWESARGLASLAAAVESQAVRESGVACVS